MTFSSQKEMKMMQNYSVEEYYRSGTLKANYSFKCGLLNGDSCTYYENGNLRSVTMLNNNRINGIERHFTRTGGDYRGGALSAWRYHRKNEGF